MCDRRVGGRNDVRKQDGKFEVLVQSLELNLAWIDFSASSVALASCCGCDLDEYPTLHLHHHIGRCFALSSAPKNTAIYRNAILDKYPDAELCTDRPCLSFR